MLKDHLYQVETIQKTDQNRLIVHISLNSEHDIFSGHFPGSPVLPGVCMVQIIKELVGSLLNRKIILRKGQTIKYQNPVNPLQNQFLTFNISYTVKDRNIPVSVQVSHENLNFCSFRGEFELI